MKLKICWMPVALFLFIIAFAAPCSCAATAPPAENIAQGFATPPAAARPWVYWFWLNGNITRQGITADLEAMRRAGIGGVLIMEVDQGAPAGPVAFGGAQWRALFHFVCVEAQRLGLQVNMNNDAGWCGSGGPWITPELSMQKLVWTETAVQGPAHLTEVLPQPHATAAYYQDVAIFALPTPADDSYRIPDISNKAAFGMREIPAPAMEVPAVPASQIVSRGTIVNVTSHFQNGTLTWDVPPGKWTLLRMGHTSTGVLNHPAPQSGLGLESDKLSRRATDAQFDGLMAHLTADNKAYIGNALVSTHIDSWETGTQNWTPTFREDFQRLRGYDPLPYLPVMTGRVVQSLDVSERFLWDVRQTVSDLLLQNYALRMRTLAHRQGIHLSIEGYRAPTDELAFGGIADEPMAEFWSSPMYNAADTVGLMASAAHTYGRRILGAEAFTADSREKWLLSPASVKTLGDWAFCAGVNRFVIHRYAMQPWLNRKPGIAMGPWGLHYERTQTWWEQSRPWHEYLARCQYLLRQGRYVADICYLAPEGAPRHFTPPVPARQHGAIDYSRYNFDSCSPQVVLTRMTVKNGLLTLPDGMHYRVLALPDTRTMTPQMLSKIAELVSEGATVIGAPPVRSPSLQDYSDADTLVQTLAAHLWGMCDGKTVTSHAYGKGRIIWGRTPAEVLAGAGTPPDFTSGTSGFRSIHRLLDDKTDIYFVANPKQSARTVTCAFRVHGKRPEFWWPETGKREPAAAWVQKQDVMQVPVRLDAAQSVFVVFRPATLAGDHVVQMTRNGADLLSETEHGLPLITRAVYGVLSEPGRTRDVRQKLQAQIDDGNMSPSVAAMAAGDDPAYGTVKTLQVEYTLAGRRYQTQGQDGDTLEFARPNRAVRSAELHMAANHRLQVRAWQSGTYQARMTLGKTLRVNVLPLPATQEINGPWLLSFPPGSNAPPRTTLARLLSWSEDQRASVRDFSGTAAYRVTFTVSGDMLTKNRVISLDLGDVQVIAETAVNGKPFGILWKPPYRADITHALKPGLNTLEVKVTNLWVNRMIGDEQLPDDSDRRSDGTLKSWPQWLLDGKPSPTGRQTFTSWRLWKKGSPRQPSGLLGPVTLSFGKDIWMTDPQHTSRR